MKTHSSFRRSWFALAAIALSVVLSNLSLWGQQPADEKAVLERATKSQTGAGYKADDWKLVTLKEGNVIYGGIPGQTEFYTTKATLDASELQIEKLFKSLQVKPHPKFGFRTKMQEYTVQKTVTVPFGKALANADLGPGGGDQYFISNFKDVLKPANIIELKKN